MKKDLKDSLDGFTLCLVEAKIAAASLEQWATFRKLDEAIKAIVFPNHRAPKPGPARKCQKCGREGKPGDWSECFTECDVCWPVKPGPAEGVCKECGGEGRREVSCPDRKAGCAVLHLDICPACKGSGGTK